MYFDFFYRIRQANITKRNPKHFMQSIKKKHSLGYGFLPIPIFRFEFLNKMKKYRAVEHFMQ